ncbi:DUF1080 domain-containing protein [Haloferula sp. A504]|uniref:DUF1080 domain-containing protein n=1 Tax=Haloferula sp. A504 TaxID=3373601 RepID=UPI0031C93F49|nr:DUF1080 domain-containing protein [Verrucomicrobiaceae bacterium E54]
MRTLTSLLLLAGLAVAAEPSFRPIFDGKTLEGWKGEGYIVEDGAIVCTPKGRNLMTERIYSNYLLDFEFKLPPGGNNGVGIHYTGEGDPAYNGMEIQVLDDTAEKYKDLKDYQFHGSIYTMVPAKKGHLKPVGEWNQQRITVLGDTVKVELNGVTITEGNLAELAKEHPKHRGVRRRAGHIALCGHGDRVSFRNLQIAEMPLPANEESVRKEGFKQLFDGFTLNRWRVEKDAKEHWVPVNGVLTYDGKGTHLWSEQSFKDFTLVFDWRWAAPGPMMDRPIIGRDGNDTGQKVRVQELDSGIYLRGKPESQVNLWNWPVGSGEVWGYRTNNNLPAEIRAGVTPKVKADRPVGEWNRMMITMKGDKLWVALNGLAVIEEARLPGVAPEGPIALQHHGSKIDFANIWIKEL